jgi:hypothetical protein
MSSKFYGIYRNYQKLEKKEMRELNDDFSAATLSSCIDALRLSFYCLEGTECLILSEEEAKLKCSSVWEKKHVSLMACCEATPNNPFVGA